jgi:hypothetical protein
MVDLPDALDVICGWGGIAEFHVLLGGDGIRAFLAEVIDAIESGRDPGAFWAKWIDVVVERTRRPRLRRVIEPFDAGGRASVESRSRSNLESLRRVMTRVACAFTVKHYRCTQPTPRECQRSRRDSV